MITDMEIVHCVVKKEFCRYGLSAPNTSETEKLFNSKTIMLKAARSFQYLYRFYILDCKLTDLSSHTLVANS